MVGEHWGAFQEAAIVREVNYNLHRHLRLVPLVTNPVLAALPLGRLEPGRRLALLPLESIRMGDQEALELGRVQKRLHLPHTGSHNCTGLARLVWGVLARQCCVGLQNFIITHITY
jgi:hypothetical protein